MPPETPIRDVVDRCRVWESHADPAVRRISKPSPDPIYPAYVVGDADKFSETTWVAAVTRQKSGPDQLEDLLPRLLTVVDTPAPTPEVPAGGSPLVDAVNPAGPDGPVVAGGPVGPCETQSPSFYNSLDPLEHSVLDYAGPDDRHVVIGPVGPFRTLSSDCHPAGPAGPYVAGGPVGPDDSFKVLEPLEHSVLDHADPAGQHAAVGTLSPSDCHPAGPAGAYVAGGPVGPDDFLKVRFWTMLTRLDSMLLFRIHWNR